jgi:hypothetical protein
MTDFQEGNFTIKLPKFLKFISVVRAVDTECHLHIRLYRLETRVRDFANVEMVEAVLTGFDSFDFPFGEELVVGLNVHELHETLVKIQQMKPDATIKVSWVKGKDQPFLILRVEELWFLVKFETLGINALRKEPNKPKIALPVFIGDCNGDIFDNAVKLCSVYSDSCQIKTGENGVCGMMANGEYCQCAVAIGKNATGANLPTKSRFSLDYLEDTAKNLRGVRFDLKLGEDHPLCISVCTEGLSFWYLIAPRVSDISEEYLSPGELL